MQQLVDALQNAAKRAAVISKQDFIAKYSIKSYGLTLKVITKSTPVHEYRLIISWFELRETEEDIDLLLQRYEAQAINYLTEKAHADANRQSDQ